MIDIDKLAAYALGRHLTEWRIRHNLSLYDVSKQTGARIESLQNIELGKGQVSTLIAYQMFIIKEGDTPSNLWEGVLYELHHTVENLRKAIPPYEKTIEDLRKYGIMNRQSYIQNIFMETDHLFAVLLLDRTYLDLKSPRSQEIAPLITLGNNEIIYALERWEILTDLVKDLYPDGVIPHSLAASLFFHAVTRRMSCHNFARYSSNEDLKRIKKLTDKEEDLPADERQQMIDALYKDYEEITNATEKKVCDLILIHSICPLKDCQHTDLYDYYLALGEMHPSCENIKQKE